MYLNEYGLRTGLRGDEAGFSGYTQAQQKALLQGFGANGELAGPQFASAIDEALNTSAAKLTERYGVFTKGEVIRIMDDGTERTIKIAFSPGVADKAWEIGVARAEALAKVDWQAWEKTLDAAFATKNLNALQVSGGWRQKGAFGADDTVHYKGRSLDINAVNGIAINNARGNVDQPDLVRQFS